MEKWDKRLWMRLEADKERQRGYLMDETSTPAVNFLCSHPLPYWHMEMFDSRVQQTAERSIHFRVFGWRVLKKVNTALKYSWRVLQGGYQCWGRGAVLVGDEVACWTFAFLPGQAKHNANRTKCGGRQAEKSFSPAPHVSFLIEWDQLQKCS